MAGTGLNTFIHCQFGEEATYGTLVPATVVMPGLTTGAHELLISHETPRTYQGDVAVVHDRVQIGQVADFDLQGLVGFENLPYFLNMVMHRSTPTPDAGVPTPGVTYANIPLLTAEDNPQSYSIEAGDNAYNWNYSGVLGRELRITAAVDGLTEFAFTGFGKARVQDDPTPALPSLLLETCPANFWDVFIDPTTLGTTAFTGCLRGFTWTVTGFTPWKCIDGSYELTANHQLGLEGTLEMTVAADDAAVALLTDYYQVSTASAFIRLEQSGSLIHTAVHKRIRLDGCYFLDTVSKWGAAEADNVNLLTLTWRARRRGSLVVAAEVVNALPSLTLLMAPPPPEAPPAEQAA